MRPATAEDGVWPRDPPLRRRGGGFWPDFCPERPGSHLAGGASNFPPKAGPGPQTGGTTAAMEHPGDRRARGPRDTSRRAPLKRKCSRDPPDFFRLISGPPFSPFFRRISARFPWEPPEIPKCRKKRRFGPSESPEKALRPPNLSSLGGDTAKNRVVSGTSRGPLENAGFAPLSWRCHRPSFDLLGKESFRRTHTLGAATWGGKIDSRGNGGRRSRFIDRFYALLKLSCVMFF